MGWEDRNGKLYYYRKYRDGQTVISQYVGTGYLAELIAEEDAHEREYEQMKRKEERVLMEADREIDRELDQIGNLVRRLTYSILLDLGYHTHRGQWRKIRDDRE